MTKQIEETMKQIRDCDFSSLSPQAAQAVWGILALSPYDTEEGHALQAKLKQAVSDSLEEVEKQLQRVLTDMRKDSLETEKSAWQNVTRHFSKVSETDSVEFTQNSLSQARSNLLHTVHPSAATLVAYYDILVTLHPDRKATDSADLYQEYLKILLSAYSKTQQFSASWWQMKSVLERYYHAK